MQTKNNNYNYEFVLLIHVTVLTLQQVTGCINNKFNISFRSKTRKKNIFINIYLQDVLMILYLNRLLIILCKPFFYGLATFYIS